MEDLKFSVTNELGIAKDNEELKSSLNGQFTGETSEVGLYLAMARVAQRAGHAEAAEVLKVIAWEEAEHAAHYHWAPCPRPHAPAPFGSGRRRAGRRSRPVAAR